MPKGKVFVKNREVGGSAFHVWAGPCAIESEGQFRQITEFVLGEGASGIRGGIYKLRTNANNFQGLGTEAVNILKTLKPLIEKTIFVSEITDPRQIEQLVDVVDVFQVGTRNMFNYDLLKELGRTKTPVLLKRSFSARVKEWIQSTEYISQGGNNNIILCERGIRTFETEFRNILDFNSVAFIKKETDFPVFVDPSHGVGNYKFVSALSKAAAAVGADGLLIETHSNPEKSLSDGAQSLNFDEFKTLMKDLKKLLPVFDKTMQA